MGVRKRFVFAGGMCSSDRGVQGTWQEYCTACIAVRSEEPEHCYHFGWHELSGRGKLFDAIEVLLSVYELWWRE
jgi:hypothetical protein